jgi:predicted NUDIX family NTP pyrophosphohydrolase
MPQPRSAGILLFRARDGEVEVLLIKPGGPFWRNRDEGAWMIPKGAIESGETAADAAIREFEEEIGMPLTAIPFPLCTIKQSGGKIVKVLAAEGDVNPTAIASVHFEMEWPPKSGELQSFPEAEEARWMKLTEARLMMLPSQLPILDALEDRLVRS